MLRKTRKKKGPDEKNAAIYADDEQVDNDSSMSKSEAMCSPAAPKRRRISQKCLKECAAKGCPNTHFWSKKWISCPVCDKNFCPFHIHLMCNHHH